MESKELTIVIVTFKSEKKIIKCLKSISSEISVIVVENSNNLDLKKKIENNFLEPTKEQLISLIEHYKAGRYVDAEKLSLSITKEFPKVKGSTCTGTVALSKIVCLHT